ncbi:MAG TPA: hypothetical protein VEB63_04605 [Chitinophagaceae bacterium]|nr:hypothetical protein [Chitinophagaceae bacterium]
MEVHRHSHQGGKRWTHYLFEFLMLFLAVFCGFLAEYRLEHTIEHQREKQFIRSLMRDVAADTAQLVSIRNIRIKRLNTIDSVMRFFASGRGVDVPFSVFVQMELLKGHSAFFQNSGTLDQLKNAGGFRLIRKRDVVDSIQSYDQQVKRMALRDLYETEEMRHASRIANRMFDGRILARLRFDTIAGLPPPATIPINTGQLGEYLNSVIMLRFVVESNMHLQESMGRRAENLLATIRNRYRISN